MIDDECTRARGLISRGHQVFLAHGFYQVSVLLEGTHAQGDRYDIILCDHDMPKGDGYEVCKNYLIERGIPVVIHSLNPWGAERMANLLEEYAVPHVILPCTEARWEERIEEIIKGFEEGKEES